MLRLFLFVSAVALLAVGSLTAFKPPEWLNWKVGLLAGEYGHYLALAALGIATLGTLGRPLGPMSAAIAIVALFAASLLAKPCVQAWRIGSGLPKAFARAFPNAPRPMPTPFSFVALGASNPPAIAPQTVTFAENLALDFYRASTQRPAACVIVVHGGGWENGDRREFGRFNHELVRAGYAVVAITYRLAPRSLWPAQRDDLLAAIAAVKARAAAWHIDPEKLVLLGRSAGGQIVETVGVATNDPAIRGIVALYAPADLEFAWRYGREDDVLNSPLLMRQLLGGTPTTAAAAFRDASAYFHVSSRTPPTLLIHGTLDPLVWHRQSERFAQRLEEEHVPHVFVSLPWATHAFDYNLHGPGGQLAIAAVEQFLAIVTAQSGTGPG